MRFYAHPILFLGFLLFPLLSRAAEPISPVSSVSAIPTPTDKTVYIEAQVVEGKKDARIEAHGNVEMQQGTQKVFADHMIYEQSSGDLLATGSVRVEQPTGSSSGPEFKMNTSSHVSEMKTPVFELKKNVQSNQKNARGSAMSMHSTGANYYEYDHVSYTTCPAGSDDWFLHMSRLDINRETQIGTAHNAWVEFEGVPILYTPWASFPLDGARHTGLLAPVYGSTTTGGTELTVPFYWNIAPNFDYTIAPRDMTKRGILIQNEFRFKGEDSYGEINYDKLPNDHLTNTSRFHSTLTETQNLGYGLRATVKLNRVSDSNYFKDLSTSLADVTQTQLLNEGVLSYGAGWLTASVKGQTYQSLDAAIPYQRMPQINLLAQKTINDATLNMTDEYVDFRHPTLAEAQRTVLYPSVTYSLLNDPGFYLKPKLGVNYTQYAMGANNTTNIADTSRTLPIFSVDSGMTFERDMNLGQREFVQTLEPRVFYVRIPYQNQDFLPVFDTSQAGLSFAQMFSENRFYGYDRIGDADMATAGLTSRLIDGDGGIERMHVLVAERYNFTLPQVNLVTPQTSPKSDILTSIGGRVTNALTLDSLTDYDPNEKVTRSAGITGAYKPETGKLLNLGYHYTRGDIPEHDLRQADFSAQWPLMWHWYAVSRLSYSLQDRFLTQRLLGLEYNQSCWMLRLVAQQFQFNATQAANSIYIQLELNDLVAVGSNPLSELRTSIPGYSKLNDAKLNQSPAGTPVQPSP